MNKKKYDKPVINIINIQAEDVITLSSAAAGTEQNLPTIGWDSINY